MPGPDQIIVGGGTAGLILVLVLVVRTLAKWHEADDKDVRAEKRDVMELNDKLAGGMRETNALLARMAPLVDQLAARANSPRRRS
jgi:hypothetical protein